MPHLDPQIALDYTEGVLRNAIHYLYQEHDVSAKTFGVAQDGDTVVLLHYDTRGLLSMTDQVHIMSVGDGLYIRVYDHEQRDWSSPTIVDNEASAKGYIVAVVSTWLGLRSEDRQHII